MRRRRRKRIGTNGPFILRERERDATLLLPERAGIMCCVHDTVGRSAIKAELSSFQFTHTRRTDQK